MNKLHVIWLFAGHVGQLKAVLEAMAAARLDAEPQALVRRPVRFVDRSDVLGGPRRERERRRDPG